MDRADRMLLIVIALAVAHYGAKTSPWVTPCGLLAAAAIATCKKEQPR